MQRADSLALIGSATRAAGLMWRDGFRYAKVGVTLLDFHLADALPAGDLSASLDQAKSVAKMGCLTASTAGSVEEWCGVVAGSGCSMHRRRLLPCHTTRVDDL